MGWNGSGSVIPTNGTGTGVTLWTQTQAAGHAILAADFDTAAVDTSGAIQACVPRNGEAAATANLPMGGFIHTGVGNGSALTHYGSIGQIQSGSLCYAGTNGGTAGALTASISPAPGATPSGMMVVITPQATNTAGATLNLNGLGAGALISSTTNAAVLAGELRQYAMYVVVRAGSNWLVLNPSSVWLTYVPTYGGFSSPPTCLARYICVGKLCTVNIISTGAGTSNSTTFTISAPLTSANVDASMGWIGYPKVTDAGVVQATVGWAAIGNNSSTITLYKDCAFTPFTNSSLKDALLTITYEVA